MSSDLKCEYSFRFQTPLIQVREDGGIGAGCPCVVQKSAEDQIDIIINPEGNQRVVCLTFDSDGKLMVELRADDNKPKSKPAMTLCFDDTNEAWVLHVDTP